MSSRLLKTLCLLALAACAPLAQAHVYRCIGAHDEMVFSGEPCGTPAPKNLRTGPLRGAGSVCARSPEALQHAIADAFATNNVNLFTGLILWRGVGQRATRARLRSLVKWLQQPLTGIEPAYATGPPYADSGRSVGEVVPAFPDADPPAGSPPPIGFAISTAAGTRDFGIVDAGRCWWLTF